jgi:hypothetical protein
MAHPDIPPLRVGVRLPVMAAFQGGEAGGHSGTQTPGRPLALAGLASPPARVGLAGRAFGRAFGRTVGRTVVTRSFTGRPARDEPVAGALRRLAAT